MDVPAKHLSQIVFNVKEYGAVGDGMAHDTVAIQSADCGQKFVEFGKRWFERHTNLLTYPRNASCSPPSTVMICPVVWRKRCVSNRKIASAWSAGVIGRFSSVRSA
jgi:hypothetical protein